MKKGVKITLITIASLLLVAIVGVFIFDIVLQNVGKRDGELLPYENIALSAKLSADSDKLGLKNLVDGRSSTYSAFKKEHTVYMEFDAEKTFNTIVIKEDMQVLNDPVWLWGSLEEFKISQINKAGEWEMFYKNDGVCDYRYIAFDSITTSKLKFEFKNENKYISIKEIEVYNTPPKPDNNLRVNEYVVMRYDQAENAKLLEKLKGYSGVITDLTLMANAFLDSKGKIMYYLGEEHRADFEKTVDQVMAFAKTYNMRVYLNIFSNYVEETDYMMRDCAGTIADTALEMCLTYGFDGIDIDWEYPRNKEQLEQYNNLLVKIKEKLAPHNKKIALSTGAWSVGFSDEAWQAIDHVAV
ncbi:MAG: glycosyl hydrolase family 18 protein, partial [Clostridia bacterium]